MTPEYRLSLGEMSAEERRKVLDFSKSETWLTAYPDAVRAYFEDWAIAQLETIPMNLTEHKTYGSDAWPKENKEIKMVPEMLNLLGCSKDNFKKLLKNLPRNCKHGDTLEVEEEELS